MRTGTGKAPSISVIVPTLDESEHILATLESTRADLPVEVVVVDGGSRDNTQELARSWGARVMCSPRGRGRQMNVGAGAARGETVLFLHGDSRLPSGYEGHVMAIMERPGVAAGAFRLRFDSPSRWFRIIEWTGNWRSRWGQLPFGDQGIFLRAGLFRRVGGFQEIPLMEDVELIRRLKRKGRVETAGAAVVTSARRYEAGGVLRRTLINKVAITAYYLGISPQRIALWYG
jgi:rSAM/selenodomain-associated transferase 2